MMRPLPRSRGFTLLEMVIAMAMSALVIASAMTLMIAQQRTFQSGSADRAMQDTARVALTRIANDLRNAGYGVDPALAFDFGPMLAVRMARAPQGSTVNTVSFRCPDAVTCRDRIDGPDEIVFLSRDPEFAKPLRAALAADSTSVSVAGPLRVALPRGQILQVMCYTAPMTWAYVTVSSDVGPTENLTVDIPINVGAAWDFPEQSQSLSDPCFQNHMAVEPVPQAPNPIATYAPDDPALAVAAKVFKVDRYRYFVQQYGGRPYLMLDRGGPDDAPNLEAIAPDVEDLQFAYVFPNAAANKLVGATPGVQLAANEDSMDLAPYYGAPGYGDTARTQSQTNHHPGNIRAVRISLVVRAADANRTDPTIPAAGNREEIDDAATGFQRMLFQTTVPTPNLGGRAPNFPMYGLASQSLNVGGG